MAHISKELRFRLAGQLRLVRRKLVTLQKLAHPVLAPAVAHTLHFAQNGKQKIERECLAGRTYLCYHLQMVGFREQLILADGSVIFYHEGRLETGEPFHLLTRVQGKMLKPYLEFIRSSQNFRIADLERWATIIRCANGALEKDEIHRIVRDTYPST